MRAFLIHISPLIFGLALLAIGGCGAGPLYVQTSGTAGPLQWEAIDLQPGRKTVDGKEVDFYDFTLVVRETRGLGLTFTNVSSTLYGGGWVGSSRWTEKFEVPPYCELHLPLSSDGFKAPLWFVRLTGSDAQGQLVDVKLPVALPEPRRLSNPDEQSAAPAASAAGAQPQSSSLLASLSVDERRRLRVADNAGLNPKELGAFFLSGAERKAAPISGAMVMFDSKVPQPLRRGLRNIAGALLSVIPVNSTVSVPVDLPEPFGRERTVRLTYIGRDSRPGVCSREIFIEVVNPAALAADDDDNASRLLMHRFIFGTGWAEEERRTLATVLDHMPDPWLGDIEGLTFARGVAHPTQHDLGGDYRPGPNTITMYDRAFNVFTTRFVPSNRAALAVAHELGHAFDFVPLRRAASRYLAALVQLDAFERYRIPGRNEYRVPISEQEAWKANNKEIADAMQATQFSRSMSGSRWRFDAGTQMFKGIDENNSDDSSNVFRKAAVSDGAVRITEYAEQSWSEYFAECFSLYVVDPQLLELLRPNIYAYFAKQFPR